MSSSCWPWFSSPESALLLIQLHGFSLLSAGASNGSTFCTDWVWVPISRFVGIG